MNTDNPYTDSGGSPPHEMALVPLLASPLVQGGSYTEQLGPALLESLHAMTAYLRRPAVSASPWITVEEAAQYARVSTDTIYKAATLGELRHSKVGTHIRIERTAVDQWLHSLQKGGAR